MPKHDVDPRAPYKVYEGDELKGTYATRAEARRRQQQLESQQTVGVVPEMTTAEWISVIALIISSGGFAIQARSWILSGPRLHLSIIADAMLIPDDGEGPRAALTVINRGTAPTMLTHMVVYLYRSRWRRFRNKSYLAGVVNSDRIDTFCATAGLTPPTLKALLSPA